MGRNKLVLVILTIVVALIIATVGVVVSGGGTNSIDIAGVAGSPNEWAGKQITLEGVVSLTTDNMFVLWDESYESNIMVKWAGVPSVAGGARVAVTGEIVTEELFGKERLYLIASELRYLN